MPPVSRQRTVFCIRFQKQIKLCISRKGGLLRTYNYLTIIVHLYQIIAVFLYNRYMLLPIEKYRLPSWRVALGFWGAFCAVFTVLFFVWPVLWGELAAVLFGGFSLPAFLAAHPSVYAGVEYGIAAVYVITSVGVLDILFCLFVYKLLDDLVFRQGTWAGLLGVSGRAARRLLVLQTFIGIWLCVAFWKTPSFSSLSLLPSLFTASAEHALLFAVWEVSLIGFACAFAPTETFGGALRFGWRLCKEHPLFWAVFFVGAFFLSWLPAYVGLKIGISGGTASSFWFIIYGASNHILWSGALLTYLFNQPDVLVPPADND